MTACISVLVVSVLLGQDPAAHVSGVIRDASSGDPVADATVVLSDLGLATTSAADGRYLLRDVPAGPQHLEVRRLGYAERALHAFVPATGGVEIHVSLQPDPVTIRGIQVSLPVAVRGAENRADSDRLPDLSLSGMAVRNHPLLAEPDAFAALSGGVVRTDPEAPHGLHVRGGSSDQVTYLLDGIPVLSPYHSAGLFSAWNPDALLRLRLESNPSGIVAPDALSGVVEAETRPPGAVLSGQGAVSTHQVRATLDGPLPGLAAGYLLSVRRGFPGFPMPDGEYSYVKGWSGDWLAKVEGAVGGGDVRLLGYANRNRTGAASAVADPGTPGEATDLPDHRFGWEGRSLGAEWARPLARGGQIQLRGWYATADATARWAGGEEYPLLVDSWRRDLGAAAAIGLGGTRLGLRVARSRSRYHAREGSEMPALQARMLIAAVSVEHVRDLSRSVHLEVGALGAVYGVDSRLSPRLEIRWTPRPWLNVAAQAVRSHQAEQSLANGESLASYLFPASLSIGAGAPGVPLARSDRASLALEARPLPGTRIAAEVYAREFRKLLLVAPVTARPFATDGFAVGAGSAAGGALEVSIARARYAVLASYGVERVRYSYGDSSYVPAFAATHRVEVGVLTFPWSTLSVRAGLTGEYGRRATAVVGPFEWEACNFLDQGCEFAGSPETWVGGLGRTRLPAYLRLDLGARKHWHLEVGSAETQIGMYASVTNLLGRRNFLTRTIDPSTGEGSWIEMRSRVPLVIGLDWRF